MGSPTEPVLSTTNTTNPGYTPAHTSDRSLEITYDIPHLPPSLTLIPILFCVHIFARSMKIKRPESPTSYTHTTKTLNPSVSDGHNKICSTHKSLVRDSNHAPFLQLTLQLPQ
ncbi:hypothetical protein M758_4G053900 [Ceratodon purpureus]|uniref:Uncharacterized protein n=1 Tax=Ceratodon purpureus TaxID=3225 RepID=A0A8T0I6B0_CERPU|nr:hypothetical protein KC19_4G064700 [Ceratodon purpureus]KAG0618312.1 hypothetical protein M758_4G053900 [Ceratodon purpureus]